MAHPQWCTVCVSGPTKSLGVVYAWCTNCGALYDEHGAVHSLPTKIGPDPKERRQAWDAYAAAVRSTPGAAAMHADELLADRDKRFGGAPEPAAKEGA